MLAALLVSAPLCGGVVISGRHFGAHARVATRSARAAMAEGSDGLLDSFKKAAARQEAADAGVEYLELFPSPEAIGVDGQRCAVIFYAYDGIPKAETFLETFEAEAADYARSGCSLVAVRRVVAGDSADERKAAEAAERFPSFNFVDGLEDLAELRDALGMGPDWLRSLYYTPQVYLLDPDGRIRAASADEGMRAPQVWGKITRALRQAVPRDETDDLTKPSESAASKGQGQQGAGAGAGAAAARSRGRGCRGRGRRVRGRDRPAAAA